MEVVMVLIGNKKVECLMRFVRCSGQLQEPLGNTLGAV